MVDRISATERSRNMSRIRSKNSAPELLVRHELTRTGIRYRLHVKELPGNPDIVIKRQRTVIFVNGCFWHQHQNCKRSTMPKTNTGYWEPKLQNNVERQNRVISELKNLGWRVVTIWECEAKDEILLDYSLRSMQAI